jgi:hypothetical protein
LRLSSLFFYDRQGTLNESKQSPISKHQTSSYFSSNPLPSRTLTAANFQNR